MFAKISQEVKMVKKIETKKTQIMSESEQSKIFGGDCPIACNCGIQCGDNLAFRFSSSNSGFPIEPPN